MADTLTHVVSDCDCDPSLAHFPIFNGKVKEKAIVEEPLAESARAEEPSFALIGMPQTVPKSARFFFCATSLRFRTIPGCETRSICGKVIQMLQERSQVISVQEGACMVSVVTMFNGDLRPTVIELVPYAYADREEHVLEVTRMAGNVADFGSLFRKIRTTLRDDPSVSMLEDDVSEDEMSEVEFTDFLDFPPPLADLCLGAVPACSDEPIATQSSGSSFESDAEDSVAPFRGLAYHLACSPETQPEAAMLLGESISTNDKASVGTLKLLLGSKTDATLIPTIKGHARKGEGILRLAV